ncbi:MAG: PxKF domain-containing protein [Acidimicrobiales bacterium]
MSAASPKWGTSWGRAGEATIALAVLAAAAVALAPISAPAEARPRAQQSDQVTGLAATQQDGFATLTWEPVEGATGYQIERTPVDGDDEPIGPSAITGVWRPNRTVTPESPSFADAGFNPGDRYAWRVRAQFGAGLSNQVVVDEPSSAAGTYDASGATFGPAPDETGIAGDIVLVTSSTGNPTEGCGPLVDFPAGAVALVDRGTCTFVSKAANAQAAGAVAMIVANNVPGPPIPLTGTDPSITIPSVMVSQDDGTTIKAGLPATGQVQAAPQAPFSEPVFGTTRPPFGDPDVTGENLRTQWELTEAAQYTNDANEYAYTAALDTLSDRVRVVEIGRTILNRPINMFIIGYPTPPATPEEISDSSTALINCNVHGNEPSSREACLILGRELAYADDDRTIDILSHTTVLIVPSINGDGRAANTRGNATGQDLNRDYSLIRQPETFRFVEMMRDYTPQTGFDGHEFGNSQAGDLPALPPRHLNVGQTIFDESQNMIVGWLYEQGSADGWWYCPYGCQGGGNVGLSQETILRNTMGLKNTIGSLLEARSSGGPTRPDELNTQHNRRRKSYSALYTYQQFLDYHRANEEAIETAVEEAIEFQMSNTGRIVFRGSRPIPAFPAPHPGESPPPLEEPTPELILEDPPCGYLLTEEQYSTVLVDDPDVPVELRTSPAQRIAAHGWDVDHRTAGHIVPMAQPERGLIPLVLDDQAVEEMLDAQRLNECPHVDVAQETVAAAAVEGSAVIETLTVANLAAEPDEDLAWTITEAAADCAAPSDLPWVSVDPANGETPASSSTDIAVTFDAGGLTAPDVHTGVLCVASNDAGDPLVAVPISLQVQYPFSGFLPPVDNPPAVNEVQARVAVQIRFSLDGDRGLDILPSGSPASQRIDCTTLEPSGPVEPAQSQGNRGLRYLRAIDTYAFGWRTVARWSGTCRQFILTLDDGSAHVAYFQFE